MRALTFDGQALTLDKAAPAPTAGPGEAIVRPLLTLITSADRSAAHPGSGFKGIPGHQFIAKVEHAEPEVGASAQSVQRAAKLKGKRVVCSPIVSCRVCDLCKGGLSAQCRDARIMGLSALDGGLCDALRVPTANLVGVPDDVENERAVFSILVGSAMHATSSFHPQGKPYVSVLGDSLLALLTVQAMSRLNASVRLIGWTEASAKSCERWGMKYRPASEVGHRQDQDVVVDCTGEARGFDLACRLARPRGRIVLKSESLAGAAGVELSRVVARELEIVGSGFGTISEGLAAIQKRHVQVDGLFTRRVRLEDAAAVLGASTPGETELAVAVMIEQR